MVSINVAIAGYFSAMYSSIVFLVLICFSCVIFALMKMFDSWFDQIINLIVHFALLVLGIVTVLYETIKFSDDASYRLSLGFICFFMAI